MPVPGPATGHGRRLRWALLAAWAVSVASLTATALLPRSSAHSHGAVLLGCGAGALIVVLVYARLLRSAAPARTLLLVGGPWQGQFQLTGCGTAMPEAVLLASAGESMRCYHCHAGDHDRPRLRVLRYEPDEHGRPAETLP